MAMTSVPAIAPHANMVKDGLYTRENPYVFVQSVPNVFTKLTDLGSFQLDNDTSYTLQLRTDGTVGGTGIGHIAIGIGDEWNYIYIELGEEKHIYSNGAHIWTFKINSDRTFAMYIGVFNRNTTWDTVKVKIWDVKIEKGDIPTHLAYLMGGVVSNIMFLCARQNEERRAA